MQNISKKDFKNFLIATIPVFITLYTSSFLYAKSIERKHASEKLSSNIIEKVLITAEKKKAKKIEEKKEKIKKAKIDRDLKLRIAKRKLFLLNNSGNTSAISKKTTAKIALPRKITSQNKNVRKLATKTEPQKKVIKKTRRTRAS